MGIKDTSFYGQKMIEEAVVPTAPRTGKAGSADESAAKGGRRGEDSPKGSAAPKPALPLCRVARGVKKMKGWPPFIASRKFVCYFFDSLNHSLLTKEWFPPGPFQESRLSRNKQ